MSALKAVVLALILVWTGCETALCSQGDVTADLNNATLTCDADDYAVPIDEPVTVSLWRGELSEESIGMCMALRCNGAVPEGDGWHEDEDGAWFVWVAWWDEPTAKPGIVLEWVIPPPSQGHASLVWLNREVWWMPGPSGTEAWSGEGLGSTHWQWRYRGDLNCDGVIDELDIDAFVLALTDPPRYYSVYQLCSVALADVNCDGRVDAGDIESFIELLARGE